jgi:hypothetical protein
MSIDCNPEREERTLWIPAYPKKTGRPAHIACVAVWVALCVCLSIFFFFFPPFAGAAAASRESKSKRHPGNEGEIDNVHIVETSQMKGKREREMREEIHHECQMSSSSSSRL